MIVRLLYSAPFFIAALLILPVALLTLRRRRARGAWYLFFLCLSASWWAATEGMLYLGFATDTNILITKLQYLGIAPLPPLALIFTLKVFDYERWASPAKQALLLCLTFVVVTVVGTNDLHRLVYSEYHTINNGPLPMLGLDHGPLWRLIIIYHYVLMALVSILIINQAVTSRGYHRAQALVMLAALLCVWIVNAVYVSGYSPVPNMDMGPLAFTLVAASMAWGFFRYSLLDILPVAKAAIFNGLEDALIVLDDQDRVIDLNPAAHRLLELPAAGAIGMPACKAFARHPQLQARIADRDGGPARLSLDAGRQVYDVHESIVYDGGGRKVGRAIAMRDITAHKLAEATVRQRNMELTRVNAELQQALKEVKELSGLLPICASCKKIRDDEGYWSEVEVYIKRHSKADFSHGICPACARQLYAEYSEHVTDTV